MLGVSYRKYRARHRIQDMLSQALKLKLKLQSIFHGRRVGMWMPLHFASISSTFYHPRWLATTHQATPQECKTDEDVTSDRSSSSTPEPNAADEAKLQNCCSPIPPPNPPVSHYSRLRSFARICAGSLPPALLADYKADPSFRTSLPLPVPISHICRTVFHGGLSINISALNVDKAPNTPQNMEGFSTQPTSLRTTITCAPRYDYTSTSGAGRDSVLKMTIPLRRVGWLAVLKDMLRSHLVAHNNNGYLAKMASSS
ncbi:uncharacterized protein ARMOST_21827 [Armillaria ostoyae]|uniref:Uncharacterized protein n=1 Tax=Armillaria ostoyae TaxID=47428 RepID=A0A284SB52_ARMOS|nr:uncharacterized protein ARMOST_21827 [Armillaria ostoyae]